ncbi:hypothetical protein LR68_04293 [Anoxybacillus sp. BCO1]|nr:hypothetical protein LR68_04293 [Anoxybacillus sp. BCO1]
MLVEGTRSGLFHCRRKSRTLNNKKVLNVCENSLKTLDLKLFPIIDDFEIIVTVKSNKTWGKHLFSIVRSRMKFSLHFHGGIL